MGFSHYKRPPLNFECPFKDRCPHLQRSYTHWIFKEYQDSYVENLEHWRVRDELREDLQNALEYIKKLEKEMPE